MVYLARTAKYSSITRDFLKNRNSNDRTFTNSENNRGQKSEKSAENALYPLWQGYVDDDRTFYSVNENAISGDGDV